MLFALGPSLLTGGSSRTISCVHRGIEHNLVIGIEDDDAETQQRRMSQNRLHYTFRAGHTNFSSAVMLPASRLEACATTRGTEARAARRGAAATRGATGAEAENIAVCIMFGLN